MIPSCRQEIDALHVFFQKWLNGALPGGREGLQRVREALADDFVIISPDARRTGKKSLLRGLLSANGNWNGGRIWIEHLEGRQLSDELALMMYEEWQQTGDDVRARLSSAIFRKAEGAPEGVEWVHLHEVWMPRG